MKITAQDLCELKLVEGVISEPADFSVAKMRAVIYQLRAVLRDFLGRSAETSVEELLEKRYERFRKF